MRIASILWILTRILIVIILAYSINSFFPPQAWGWRVHDLMYRYFRSTQSIDTQIVIIDLGQLRREELARLLLRLKEVSPKIIGIDAIFPYPHTPHQDSLWRAALCQTSATIPVVLASTLDLKHPLLEAPRQSVSLPAFTDCTEEAYANMVLYEDYAPKTVWEFFPYTVSQGDTHYSLALRLALALQSSLRSRLSEWSGIQPLLYRGNLNAFYFASGYEILYDSLPINWMRDKIILIGLADPLRQTLEDIFFTPLNPKLFPRDFPDMYGVVIHANILSMLLHNEPFLRVGEGWIFLMMVVIHAGLIGTWMYLPRRWQRWLALRILQLIFLTLAVAMTVVLVSHGVWLPVEPLLWGILISGEIELLQAMA
ncbi:MAG: CHASE2 domain-containing protein [Bacteroidia bacterium]|nr:CHASE2 domain-containing protein [Bacteroidia bacterium]MDW8235666.1 CHASE2 domain-containing protein [Bacteroidia bacterium]